MYDNITRERTTNGKYGATTSPKEISSGAFNACTRARFPAVTNGRYCPVVAEYELENIFDVCLKTRRKTNDFWRLFRKRGRTTAYGWMDVCVSGRSRRIRRRARYVIRTRPPLVFESDDRMGRRDENDERVVDGPANRVDALGRQIMAEKRRRRASVRIDIFRAHVSDV